MEELEKILREHAKRAAHFLQTSSLCYLSI